MTTWDKSIREAWAGRNPLLGAALVPFSWAWGAGAAVHRAAYATGLVSRAKVDVPVVSVGNLVVGGAGKTPVVAFLAKAWSARGRRVAIVSRGYGRIVRSTAPVLVSDGTAVRATAEEGGDEPVWLARRLPGVIVLVDADRRAASETAIQLGADLVLLDDGFSHHALRRDADVLVVDAKTGLGNERLLPAGPLREPVSRGKSADLVWLSRCETDSDPVPASLSGLPLLRTRAENTTLANVSLQSLGPASDLRGKPVVGFAGLARPESFEATLRELGADVRAFEPFPDHHRFDKSDLDHLAALRSKHPGATLVTTEKDAMRLTGNVPDDFAQVVVQETRTLGDTSALDALLERFSPGIPAVSERTE